MFQQYHSSLLSHCAVDGCCRGPVVDQQLEVRLADPVHVVVLDVGGPGPALDVEQHPGDRVGEPDGHQGGVVGLTGVTALEWDYLGGTLECY